MVVCFMTHRGSQSCGLDWYLIRGKGGDPGSITLDALRKSKKKCWELYLNMSCTTVYMYILYTVYIYIENVIFTRET